MSFSKISPFQSSFKFIYKVLGLATKDPRPPIQRPDACHAHGLPPQLQFLSRIPSLDGRGWGGCPINNKESINTFQSLFHASILSVPYQLVNSIMKPFLPFIFSFSVNSNVKKTRICAEWILSSFYISHFTFRVSRPGGQYEPA